MNVDALIAKARQKLSGRTPAYIDLHKAALEARQEVADFVVGRVQSAMEQAILGAQSILRSTCEEYIEALYVTENTTIAIRADKSYLEYGYDQREMLPDLLNSPKAKTDSDGKKYVVVPIGDKPAANIRDAIGKKTTELFTKGRRAGGSGRSLSDMATDMQSLARRSTNAPVVTRTANNEAFATASEKQDSGKDWVHPGFQGVNQLEFINEQLRVDLEEGVVRILEDEVNRMRR